MEDVKIENAQEKVIDITKRVTVYATDKHPYRGELPKNGIIQVAELHVDSLVEKGFVTLEAPKEAKKAEPKEVK